MSNDLNSTSPSGNSSCLRRIVTLAVLGFLVTIIGTIISAFGIFNQFQQGESDQALSEAEMTLQAQQLEVAIDQYEILLTQVALQMTIVYIEVVDPYAAQATLQVLDSTRGSTLARVSAAQSTLTPYSIHTSGPGYGTYKNPIEVRWIGDPGASYRVTLINLRTSQTIQSDWMSGGSWKIEPPLDGELFGEWEWYVESSTGVFSNRDKFVFDPHYGRIEKTPVAQDPNVQPLVQPEVIPPIVPTTPIPPVEEVPVPPVVPAETITPYPPPVSPPTPVSQPTVEEVIAVPTPLITPYPPYP
jgi:hypothetical protein